MIQASELGHQEGVLKLRRPLSVPRHGRPVVRPGPGTGKQREIGIQDRKTIYTVYIYICYDTNTIYKYTNCNTLFQYILIFLIYNYYLTITIITIITIIMSGHFSAFHQARSYLHRFHPGWSWVPQWKPHDDDVDTCDTWPWGWCTELHWAAHVARLHDTNSLVLPGTFFLQSHAVRTKDLQLVMVKYGEWT